MRLIKAFAMIACFILVASASNSMAESIGGHVMKKNPKLGGSIEQSGTNLSGRIIQDMTLGGDIVIDGDVVVEKGVSLTILEGSKISFNKGGLEIHGAFVAIGAKDAPIAFIGNEKINGVKIVNSKESKSIISFGKFSGFDTAVSVVNSRAVIINSVFTKNLIAVDAKQKDETIIKNNIIKDGHKVGIFCKSDSQAEISSNRISDVKKFGIYVYRSGDVKVLDNTISKCSSGLMVGFVGSDSHVSGNLITLCKTGIIIEKGANPSIEGNTLKNNEIGMSISKRSDPIIKGNDISGGKNGIYISFSSYPKIVENNIFDNNYAIYLKEQSVEWEKAFGESMKRGGEKRSMGAFGAVESPEFIAPRKNLSAVIDAKKNFWGRDVTEEMESKGKSANISVIYDYYDAKEFVYEGKKYKLDTVDYSDWSLVKFHRENKNKKADMGNK